VRRDVSTNGTDIAGKVNSWFRKLAKRFHPDAGGNDAVMAALNHAHDELRAALGIVP
jgi:curved DNA-binding protein CbpA